MGGPSLTWGGPGLTWGGPGLTWGVLASHGGGGGGGSWPHMGGGGGPGLTWGVLASHGGYLQLQDEAMFLLHHASMVTPLKMTPPQLDLSHTLYGDNANQSPPAETFFVPQPNLATSQSTADQLDSNTMPFMVNPAPVSMATPSHVPISTVTEDLAISSENDSDSDSDDSDSGSSSSSSDSDSEDSGEDANMETEGLNGEHQLSMSQTNEDLVLFPSPVNSPMCFYEEMGFDHISQDPHLYGSLGNDLVPSEDPPPPAITPQQMSTPNNFSAPLPSVGGAVGGAVGAASPHMFQQEEDSSGNPGLPGAQAEIHELSGAQTNDREASNVAVTELDPKRRTSRDVKRSQLAACGDHPSSQSKEEDGEEASKKPAVVHQVAGKKRKWAEPNLTSTTAPLKAPRLHRYSSVESTHEVESTLGEAPSSDSMGNSTAGMGSRPVVTAGMESGPMIDSDQTLVVSIPLTLVKKKRMATVEPYHVTAPSEKASRRRSEGQESVEEVWWAGEEVLWAGVCVGVWRMQLEALCGFVGLMP